MVGDYEGLVARAKLQVEGIIDKSVREQIISDLVDAVGHLLVKVESYREMRDRVSMVIGGHELPPESNPRWRHRALEAESQCDALRAQLDSIRKYADERAAYGRRNRTVGSARIASDLFAILDAEQTIAELAERQAQPNGLEGVL